MLRHPKKESHANAKFLLRRFFRIYPLFFICVTFVYLVYSYAESLYSYLNALMILQRDYHLRAPFFGYSMLYPAWTLSFEVLFYSVFLLSMCISHNDRALICSAILISFFFLIQITTIGGISLNAEYSPDFSFTIAYPLIRMLSSPMMLEFVIGMISFYLYDKLKNKKSLWMKCLSCILIIDFIYMYFMYNTINHGPSQRGLISAMLFFGMLLLECGGVFIKSKIASFFGDISYSLYLSHVIVIKIASDFARNFNIEFIMHGYQYLLLIFAACVLTAFGLHRLVELPMVKIGKKITGKL